MPSHLARIEPSGFRAALETRLQSGKLYLMSFEATALESPFGAAPTAGAAANAGQTDVSSDVVVRIIMNALFMCLPLKRM